MSSNAPEYGRTSAAPNPITEGVIWKQILFFFFPLLLSSFFQQLYNTADALIVGRIAGKQALSAVGGSSGSVLNIFMMFYLGFSGGAAVLAAQFYGAKKDRALLKAVRASLILSTVLGFIGAAVCLFGARPILTAMNTPADIMESSLWYLRIVAMGLIPNAVYNMGAAALRATGDSRRPLAVLIMTCLINIGLDMVLVALLGLGAIGAAIATTICQLLSAFLSLCFLRASLSEITGLGSAFFSDRAAPHGGSFLNKKSSDDETRLPELSDKEAHSRAFSGEGALNREPSVEGFPGPELSDKEAHSRAFSDDHSRRDYSPAKKRKEDKRRTSRRPDVPDDISSRILLLGLPLGFSEVMYTFANVILMSVVNGFGTDTVAAYAAYGKIDAIFWMIVGSFGIAITTFVGQNIGAGRWDRVMKSIRECAVMMFISLGIVIAALRFFAFPLQQLFCTDPDVVEIGVRMMRFLLPFYFLYIPIEVLFGALRGMGDSIIPTIITFFGICVLRSAWGLFIVPLHHTVNMVLLAYPVTWLASDIAFAIYFILYLRMRRAEFKK